MIWTQPDAISAFPCCTGSDMFTWVSGILEDMSALCPCANARQAEHPHYSLAPSEAAWEGSDRAPTASKHRAYGITSLGV